MLDAIAENALRFTGAKDALIRLERDGKLVLVAHHGEVPWGGELGTAIAIEPTSVNGRAFLEGRTVQVGDLLGPEGNEYASARARATRWGYRASLAAPLVRQGGVIGTILLRKMEPVAFDEKQVKLIEAFADQAVIAIENRSEERRVGKECRL